MSASGHEAQGRKRTVDNLNPVCTLGYGFVLRPRATACSRCCRMAEHAWARVGNWHAVASPTTLGRVVPLVSSRKRGGAPVLAGERVTNRGAPAKVAAGVN